MRKLAAASTGFCDLCFRRLGMYTAPNKQAAPNNGLTVNCAMILQGPSHCRISADTSVWSTGLQSWGPSERWRYTETWQHALHWDATWLQLYLVVSIVSDWSWMKHRCTKTQQWVATLRPQWKVGIYRNLTACMGTVSTWRAARQCQLSLNLKVGKMNYCLGSLDHIWAKCSESTQNFSRNGQKNLFIKFVHNRALCQCMSSSINSNHQYGDSAISVSTILE